MKILNLCCIYGSCSIFKSINPNTFKKLETGVIEESENITKELFNILKSSRA